MEKRRLHYAWVILAACMVLYYGSVGLAINCFSTYSPYILSLNGFTKTQVSLLMTVRTLFQILAVGCTAKFYQHVPPRSGLALAGLTVALGYVLLSFAGSYTAYLVCMAVIGVGYGLGSMVAVSMLLGRWFRAKRTLAVSLVSAMTGLGTMGFPTVIARLVQKHGLAFPFRMEACIIAGAVVIAFLLLRNRPEDLGLKPYGAETGVSAVKKANQKERQPLSKWNLALLYMMLPMTSMTCSAGWQTLSLHASTEGFSSEQVALCVTVAGAALMTGKFIFGTISDRLTLKKTSVLYLLVLLASCLMLIYVGSVRWLLYPAMALFGGALTTITIGCVTWADDWFPPEQHDQMVARFQMLYSCGSLGTTLLPGLMADLCGGSYVPFLWVCVGSVVFVLAVLLYTYRCTETKMQGEA